MVNGLVTSKEIEMTIAQAGGGDLRETLIECVQAAIRHDFHQPSQTHIVFCLAVGRWGVKGFGPFPQEAKRNFDILLHQIVSQADPSEIEKWLGRVRDDGRSMDLQRQIEQIAQIRGRGEYSLGLDPEQLDELQQRSGGRTVNDLVVDWLEDGWPQVDAEVRASTQDEMRERLKGIERAARQKRREGDKIVVRTFRMSPKLHARLEVQAHEIGVKLPELCRYILDRRLLQQKSASESATEAHDGGEVVFLWEFARKKALISRARQANAGEMSLAARQGAEQTENDIDALLEDMIEVGLIDEKGTVL